MKFHLFIRKHVHLDSALLLTSTMSFVAAILLANDYAGTATQLLTYAAQ